MGAFEVTPLSLGDFSSSAEFAEIDANFFFALQASKPPTAFSIASFLSTTSSLAKSSLTSPQLRTVVSC